MKSFSNFSYNKTIEKENTSHREFENENRFETLNSPDDREIFGLGGVSSNNDFDE